MYVFRTNIKTTFTDNINLYQGFHLVFYLYMSITCLDLFEVVIDILSIGANIVMVRFNIKPKALRLYWAQAFSLSQSGGRS